MKIEVKYPLVKVCYMMSSPTMYSQTLMNKQKKATLLKITKIAFKSMEQLHDLIDDDYKDIEEAYYPEIQDKMIKIMEKLHADLHSEYLEMLALNGGLFTKY